MPLSVLRSDFVVASPSSAPTAPPALDQLKSSTRVQWSPSGASSHDPRDISIGGNRYTEAIQREMNLSQEEAEALKQGKQEEGIPAEQVQPILSRVNEEVGNEIQKTLDFFKATTSGESVQHLVFSGGTSRVPGLTDYMAERFQTPVEVLNPFSRLADAERVLPAEQGEEIAPSMAVAVGLRPR